MVTNTVDISLKLTDDQWTIESDDKVLDAMLGGMLSSADSISDSLGGDS